MSTDDGDEYLHKRLNDSKKGWGGGMGRNAKNGVN